jgi:protein-S-isoprenylcysteine O-methyltransferase Ste14
MTTGPYRLTRNPAYLGMALIYIGIALLANTVWVLVPLPVVLVVIDRAVIAREERYLERKFGAEYVDYSAACAAGSDQRGHRSSRQTPATGRFLGQG